MSDVETWLGVFRARTVSLPGAALPWLGALRQRAIERFADEGWPTNRMDDWRHTSLAFLAQQGFAEAAPAASAGEAVARLRGDDDSGHWLVFVDGHFAPAWSEVRALPAGARVGALSMALADGADRVQESFGGVDRGTSAAALNAALASDGAFIHLARGVALEAPIHLVFVAATPNAASHLRNLVVAEAGAQATIVEHWVGVAAGSASLSNAVTRIDAGADARITHVKMQQEDEQAVHLATIEVAQARGSVLDSHSLSFGARLARNDIVTRFDGEGCEALLNGLYHVDGRRHVDHHTRIDHRQPRGTSREYYRGIVDGSARGVFAGRILVAPGAMRTDAIQRTDNLLLSAQAEADARPELEIYADDVKCAHGATVGQIDEASLFYLRSRGIDEPHARNLLTYAFATEALARIGLAPLRRRAAATLRARLPGGELMEELS
ncbi:MAG: Fe-S cluster assembly protein SufD [Burkholderiaceae bacterium]|nr:Fe-S cluster assembly protein SufD [Burkholderiaceae bacterium]